MPLDDPLQPASPEDNTLPPSQDPADETGVVAPPRSLIGTLRQLGPGLIIAGSIVGSGELIATTKTGAQAGMTLLWLIIIGCVIKVFVQIELGRMSITHGVTTLAALNRVPGRIGPVNWILWFWLAMMSASIAQLGGIVGGVGQALALSFPLRGDYVEAIQIPSAADLRQYLEWDASLLSAFDLRMREVTLQSHQEESARTLTGTSAAIDPVLEAAEREWRAERLLTLEQHWDRLALAQQTEIDAAFTAAFSPGEPLAPLDREERRVRLRTALDAVNEPLVRAELDRRAAAGALPAPPTEAEIRRILRGHEVLSEHLADVGNEGENYLRIEAAVAAQSLVGAAQRGLKAVLARQPSGSAESLAEPLHTPDVALAQLQVETAQRRVAVLTEPWTWDDKYWAAVVTFLTIALLYNGRYGIIQNLSTALVVLFTFITIGNVLSLQTTAQWRISGDQLMDGLRGRLPQQGLKMALATFGIIGVGATELLTYPYWCIEKGYARFTGWRNDSEAWAARARGWMRVMHWDAFISMIIYTVATLAFYMLGAAVLFPEGRDPDGMRMVSTLAAAYVPVFGEYARHLFLVGAVAVLYSTFLVANAGHARMFTDGIKIFGLVDPSSQRTHDKSITFFCVLLPLVCLAIFWSGINPVEAVAFAGMMQATMLPMIGFGALYFRWTATDPRLAPSRLWDLMLYLSFVGLLVVGVYGFWSKIRG